MADVWEGTKGTLVAGRAPAGSAFTRGIIDSREARPGDLFFALRGERHDGHDFVRDAFAAGAAGAVVERPVEAPENGAVFHVGDSLSALQELAAHWRLRHDIRVTAVTGSVGKTTCKELIAAVLASKYRILKSEANINTEIGIPLTILGLTSQHQHAVLEFGMYAPGDIALLSRIAAPSIGVVTNIGPVHLERLGSIGAIVATKAELVESLPPDGVAILNGDDARTAALAARSRARTVLYGLSPQCSVRATDVVSRGLAGFSFNINHDGRTMSATCPLPGKHHVYPALAATAVALAEGLTLPEIAGALRSSRPDLRLRIIPGPGGSTIIDDSYNASPASMLAALDLLSELPGRRLALLGEMRELGAAEVEGHRAAGQRAASACDILFVAGERARPLADAARAAGPSEVRFLESGELALAALRKELKAGDHILVKASRAMGFETLVDALVAQ